MSYLRLLDSTNSRVSGLKPPEVNRTLSRHFTIFHLRFFVHYRKMFPNNQKYINSYEKVHQCDMCKKTFSQQSNLCKHVLIHYGLRPYGCDICGKRFTQQANLIKHKRIHTGDKPFVCKVCGRGFSQKANLKKHAQLHTGEKHFRCDFCEKAFAQLVNLDRHRRTHTGEKPYRCNVCDKKFTQSGNLAKHELIHYLKNGSNNQTWPTHPPLKVPTVKEDVPLMHNPTELNRNDHLLKLDFDGYHTRKVGVPVILSPKDEMLLKRL